VRAPVWLVAALLAAITAAVFWPVLGFDFVNYDDPMYVTENVRVQRGLSGELVRWAFTTTYAANWHPLTWLSYGLDWSLWGRSAAGYHAGNLVLHALATVFLFLLLVRMTGAVWRSALVAALFALHPLHVESVAWVSERKDVLSACLWFLTTMAYVAYARGPSAWRYALVVAGLALGLMAKPMLVTLPFTLLLLDYWPLGRLRDARAVRRAVVEKLPLLGLAAAVSVVTMLAQAGALRTLATYSLSVRIGNAVVSYATYLWKAVWPLRLGVLYPHPGDSLSLAVVAGSAALLLAVTALAVVVRRSRPWVLVGWLWYLGTLVPVIGVVQAGEQAMADRFTYVALVGVFVAMVWSLPSWRMIPAVAVIVLALLAFQTRAQLAVWRDTVTLYEHALLLDERNSTAHANLGAELIERGEAGRAKPHLERCIELTGACPDGLQNLATIVLDEGRPAEAIPLLERALALRPDFADAHYNLGNVYVRLGRDADAIQSFRTALRYNPDAYSAAFNLANTLTRLGALDDAIQAYQQALRIKPDLAGAANNLGSVYLRQGDFPAAARQYQEALRLDPSLEQARQGLEAARQAALTPRRER
jgi:tetratricopeptide (TPR) repeat protein